LLPFYLPFSKLVLDLVDCIRSLGHPLVNIIHSFMDFVNFLFCLGLEASGCNHLASVCLDFCSNCKESLCNFFEGLVNLLVTVCYLVGVAVQLIACLENGVPHLGIHVIPTLELFIHKFSQLVKSVLICSHNA
jgi:hypothetical protein